MDATARAVGELLGTMVLVATPLIVVTAAFFGPVVVVATFLNIRRIRKQLERLNDILESRLSLDNIAGPRA